MDRSVNTWRATGLNHTPVSHHQLRSLSTLVREYLDDRPDVTCTEVAARLLQHGFCVTPAMISSIFAAIRTG